VGSPAAGTQDFPYPHEVALTGTGGVERLGGRRPVTAVVRVVLARDGSVRHGEVLDAASGAGERFVGWEGLVAALGHWVTRAGGHD
jgi:hypothetical protein